MPAAPVPADVDADPMGRDLEAVRRWEARQHAQIARASRRRQEEIAGLDPDAEERAHYEAAMDGLERREDVRNARALSRALKSNPTLRRAYNTLAAEEQAEIRRTKDAAIAQIRAVLGGR